MDTMMIVMLLCCYPILWVMVGVFAAQASVKKCRPFGLELPENERKSGDACLIIYRCRKMLLWFGILLSVLVLPMFWVRIESIQFTFWMTWIMLVIIFPILIYGHYFQCMKKLKLAKGMEMGKEEHCWHWGIFYCNKDNPKLLVPHGTGNTMNMARFSGKISMALVGLCLFTLPLWGVWIMVEDFTEAQVTIGNDAVTAKHLGTEYVVAYDDVTEVSLLREMPGCSRNVGYELAYLTKGDFSVEGYGNCKVCVDSRDETILALETADDRYLISFDSEAEALEAIDNINIE